MRAFANPMRLVFLFLGCTLPGCTSLHVVERPSPGIAARDYDVRDRVVVVRRDGEAVDMRITKATPDLLAGVDATGRSHEIPVGQIERIQVRRFSAGKTAGLVLLVGAAAIAIEIDRNGIGMGPGY